MILERMYSNVVVIGKKLLLLLLLLLLSPPQLKAVAVVPLNDI
jgi:hypothetical protein